MSAHHWAGSMTEILLIWDIPGIQTEHHYDNIKLSTALKRSAGPQTADVFGESKMVVPKN